MVEPSIAPTSGAERGARSGAAATDRPIEGREPRTTTAGTTRHVRVIPRGSRRGHGGLREVKESNS